MATVRDDAHWAAYNARQQTRAVRLLCQEVLTAAGPAAGRSAIDFGCGAGVETRAMLTSGWRALALDGEPGTRDRVLATTLGSAQERLTIKTIRFPDLNVLPAADLVYAGYSLPYIHPDDFIRVWALIRSSLRPGAWFAGNFFGDRDSWADDADETFLSEEAVRALFVGMEIVSFNEEDEDGQADSGPKHWHVFDVIARQPHDVRAT
jgi:trans-aconitate methyltransferase